MIAIRFT